ncbi:glutamine amidotransferase family protein [Sinorhizobium meliloti WSM1022]|jgi:glutamate synthase domain-containing protein 1|uniref:Glutamine amidotransferase-like protein GlxB n=5 Tax=Sinorhizobium TaxID=28105 RepID=GLXB_RHIME|nr:MULTISPECIES: glutamine amidotransferase family protein [Sinorhizobium]O87390.3 RecName: Full=Glutamine amidotransferase-like protein GlxB [Sinorhizobium meliloti 1021]PST30099.1 glutamine amidotransferase [Mesorhizobium loti]TWA90088.1 N-methylglutamate synthase subunit A [Ensifer sp. SEMIA 134]TWB26221.1 N-methylglutamate synthase subunit A [Ensifer sp. SEMIA 135]AEG06089.1 glutamine amidotransferase class-II [Sinorhizobium meliloti BL225C]AEG55123.1 glutamine amidotransferase class-II [
MCGIVGLFLKDSRLEPQLGQLLSDMLITMTDRGPDSAGLAIYGSATEGKAKVTIQSAKPEIDFADLERDLAEAGVPARVAVKSTHAVVAIAAARLADVRAVLAAIRPDVRIMGAGDSVEIYKEVGLPKDVVARFDVRSMGGSHGIGHTRMATESAVTTLGAHPFSTGSDQCLVHNGSLSNHNNLRRELIREGIAFETQNDTEVAAAYLTAEMAKGKDLGQALTGALDDLDGFFTFVVGTKSGFGVVRDPIACKPAVMAETDRYVAFGSEYRALVNLPDIESARIWEPEPATVYFWDHQKAA